MKTYYKFTNKYGHEFIGVVVGESHDGGCWFLPMCDDHKTWMKEPIWAVGVLPA